MVDVHHMQSDGYQTFNYQYRNAGDIQVQYKLSSHTTLTGYSGVIWVDANTPNLNATRCQMYGANPALAGSSSTYASLFCTTTNTATGTALPYTGAGLNFLLANNSDPIELLRLTNTTTTMCPPTSSTSASTASGARAGPSTSSPTPTTTTTQRNTRTPC